MTPQEKKEHFKIDLAELLKKYNAEISIQDFGISYMTNNKIVVSFDWCDETYNKSGSGMIDDIILGTYITSEFGK